MNHDIHFHSRFIDDGFLVCKPTIDVGLLIRQLQAVTNLKLTFEKSEHQCIYLDIVIYKGQRYQSTRRFDTKTFFKPTNKFLYLPSISNHPPAQKKGIIKGEAIRCLRGCSDKENWLIALRTIFSGMMARGYHPTAIKKELKKVRFEDREKYIFENSESKRPKKRMVMTEYHKDLRKNWNRILAFNPVRPLLIQKRLGRFNKRQLRFLEEWRPQIVFKNFKTIGTSVISAKQDSRSRTQNLE